MRFAKGQLAALLLVLTLLTPAASRGAADAGAAESAGLSAPRLARLDALMDDAVRDRKLGGAVVLVARRGTVAYLKAFGYADSGRPMQTDAIFRIASMTKPLTSTAVMLLYEEGRILLSDPISKYIPEFENAKVLEASAPGAKPAYRLVPAKRPITIRDLLTHTSGISYGFLANWLPDQRHLQLAELYREGEVSDGLRCPDGSLGDMVKTLARLPLISQPGESFEYGLSTDVLGYLVEVVSGMTLEEFMQRRIFTPLKMQDTFFNVPQEKRSRVAALWNAEGGRLDRMSGGAGGEGYLEFSPELPASPVGYFSGGAGLYSTASDYLRFCQMLLNKGELDGVRLLSPRTVELMTATNHIGNLDETLLHGKGWKFGLGFAIEKERGNDVDAGSVGTYEWAGIFSTRFSVDPADQRVTIFLSQTQPFNSHTPLWDRITTLSSCAVLE